MNERTHELRNSEEFDQSVVQKKGTLKAPGLSLSGNIIQRNHKVEDEQQLEYYFQLSLTDLQNGLAIWENETLSWTTPANLLNRIALDQHAVSFDGAVLP